jgi:hypothetical protein
MKKKLMVLSGVVFGLAPIVAFAQNLITGGTATGGCNIGPNGNAFGILCQIGNFLNAVIPVLIALAVVYFVWGVVTYVISDDEEAKKRGRDRIIYGIIGLAVIVGVWGLVHLLENTFGLSNTTSITPPTVPVFTPNQ